MIDTKTDSVVGDPIDVATGPRGVAISPDGSRAFVATGFFSTDPGTLTGIDIATAETDGEPIPIGNHPLGVAIVPDQPPVASLATAAGVLTGQPVHFDASASHDPDGQIARYDWDFGDGQTALDAGPTPTHTYSAPGAYQATVTLTDSEGCSTGFVFTGITASCNGSSVATAASTVGVAAPQQQGEPPLPVIVPPTPIHIRHLRRVRHRGIAKLRISVPVPGTLSLRGRHVRGVKRTVAGAGIVTLVVRPKRREMRTLKRRGRLKVGMTITFHPDGGEPTHLHKKLKLIRTRP